MQGADSCHAPDHRQVKLSQVNAHTVNLPLDTFRNIRDIRYLSGLLGVRHTARINEILPDFMDTGIDHLLSGHILIIVRSCSYMY